MAFPETSIPVPLDKLSSFKMDSSIQPEPVPISRIFTLLFLKNFIILYIKISVSGLGTSVERFTKKSSL